MWRGLLHGHKIGQDAVNKQSEKMEKGKAMSRDFQVVWPIFQRFAAMLPNLHNNQWAEAAKQFFTAVSVQNALAFIRMILSECSMDIRGKTVIDAGCGLGQNTMLFALLGAEKVYGVDLDEERISAFRLALESWRRVSDTMDRVELVVEDIMTYIPGRKADLMFCNEMLSHLWDRKAFYKKTSGMLSGGGGRLFASDGNNGANRKITAYRKRKWQAAESPGGRIYEARKSFIINKFPALTGDKALDYLTLHTCYQRPDELIENIGEYLASGQLRRASSFNNDKAPYDPEYCFLPNEDLLYPESEARWIREAGLKPRMIPYFMGAKRQYLRPINSVLGAFPAFSIPFARGLHIVATKL